ncbi:hypothetical protein PMAYCL1PPCAC_08426, partial [Pristionchus mayeri]
QPFALNASMSSVIDSDSSFLSQFYSNFKPKKILGHGGFGCVFEAEKHVMERIILGRFAVKRIPLPRNENDIASALKEVEVLLNFDHKGIVKFYDAWTEQPPPGWQAFADGVMLGKLDNKVNVPIDCAFLYILMELCQFTLEDWLLRNDERDLEKIKTIFKQIASAVAYIHQKNYIHRDLKPSNILFVDDNTVKVCDLGIVTDRALAGDDSGQEVTMERTNAKGTQRYMAPEQMGLSEYSSKVDIFALGLILAEMCIVMNKEKADEVFNNYRSGVPNDVLEHFPEVEQFVALLTNLVDTERPNAEVIVRHEFLLPEDIARELRKYHGRIGVANLTNSQEASRNRIFESLTAGMRTKK